MKKPYLICRKCEVYTQRVNRAESKRFRREHRGCRVLEWIGGVWVGGSRERKIDAVSAEVSFPSWFKPVRTPVELLALCARRR